MTMVTHEGTSGGATRAALSPAEVPSHGGFGGDSGRETVPATGPRADSPIERLLSLWYQARKDKGFVTRREAGSAAVGDLWPNCFIIDYQARDASLVYAHIGRLPQPANESADPGRDGAMVLEWMADLARVAFTTGKPIVRSETFPCDSDGSEYDCAVLPLTDEFGAIKSVLAYIGVAARDVQTDLTAKG